MASLLYKPSRDLFVLTEELQQFELLTGSLNAAIWPWNYERTVMKNWTVSQRPNYVKSGRRLLEIETPIALEPFLEQTPASARQRTPNPFNLPNLLKMNKSMQSP